MSLELASTCVNWLRERSNLGAKPSDQVKTERKTYKLEMDQRTAGFNRLRFLPPCLAVLMIAGMAAGVTPSLTLDPPKGEMLVPRPSRVVPQTLDLCFAI